jgi:hypothetical protein
MVKKKLTEIDKNDPGGTSKSTNNWREISEPASRKSAIQVTTGGFFFLKQLSLHKPYNPPQMPRTKKNIYIVFNVK